VKPESDHTSIKNLRVLRKRRKVTGGFLVIIGLAIVVLDSYWSPYIGNLLYRLRIEPVDAQYLLSILGYFPYLLIAAGGFMLLRSSQRPLRSSPEQSEEERISS